jgi:L-amino acid N-acyltransferase YncA
MARGKSVSVSVKELAALSFAAQRYNGGLLKDTTRWNENTQTLENIIPNKTLIRDTVKGDPKLVVTDEDRAQAEIAIDAITQDFTMQVLKGRKVSDFVQSLATLLEKDTDTDVSAGIVAFLPQMYEQLKQRQDREEKVQGFAYTSEYLGQLGAKVTVELTVLTTKYLQQYNCYSVTGHDAQGNMVNFLTGKQDCTVSGRYTGKIKRIEQSPYHNNAKVTQLNFVKLLK